MYYGNGTRVSCFRVIKDVLDELYEKLPDLSDGRTKDQIIQEKLKELREDYAHLPYGKLPNYADPYKCFAYLYCYVAAHANIVCGLIDQRLGNLFDSNEVRVSCLGGGPCSDLLGIIKFLIKENKSAKLKCYVYDRENNWYHLWSSIQNMRITNLVTSSFNQLDIARVNTWVEYSALWNVDLFTMSYFVSEIYPMRNQSKNFFTTLFEKAKRGSHILLIDNYSGKSHYWFDSLIESYNTCADSGFLESLGKSDNETYTMSYNEQKTDLGLYYEKFKGTSEPKTLGKDALFVYRIYRKN